MVAYICKNSNDTGHRVLVVVGTGFKLSFALRLIASHHVLQDVLSYWVFLVPTLTAGQFDICFSCWPSLASLQVTPPPNLLLSSCDIVHAQNKPSCYLQCIWSHIVLCQSSVWNLTSLSKWDFRSLFCYQYCLLQPGPEVYSSALTSVDKPAYFKEYSLDL